MLPDPSPDRSSATLGTAIVTAAAAVAIVYATLYPFSGWRPWSSLSAVGLSFMFDPWPRYWTRFDVLSNVAMYVPFAALLASVLGQRMPGWAAALACIVIASLLSMTLEWIQVLLPGRVPSRLDWAANSVGAVLGATASMAIGPRRAGRWSSTHRHRLPFAEGSVPGIAVLLAWLAAQAEPQAMSFATGRVLDLMASQALIDPELLASWRLSPSDAPFAEGVGVFLTAIAIGGLLRELLRPEVRWLPFTALWLAAAALIKVAATAWLLHSGAPLGWLSASTQGGLLLALVALAAMNWVDHRASLRITLLALAAATVVFNLTPPSDYHRVTIAGWDHGQWANAAGLARGLALCWPFAAMLFAASRLRRYSGRRRL